MEVQKDEGRKGRVVESNLYYLGSAMNFILGSVLTGNRREYKDFIETFLT